jgi:hypothetical protein
MFIDKARQQNQLNAEEVRRLCDVIERDDGKYRVPKGNDVVIDLFMKEYKKLKIENNHDTDTKKKDDISNVNYADNRSRWIRWNNFNKVPNHESYEHSASHPGFWRTPSGNYRRAPDRTPSRGQDHDRGSYGGHPGSGSDG